MVTVGVADGEIAYVSSSLTRTTGRPGGRRRSPALQAWLKAAAERRPRTSRRRIARHGHRTGRAAAGPGSAVPGFAQEQQVRLRALALADGTVRPVFETNVVDVAGGAAFAYTADGRRGHRQILHRQNQVENSSDAVPVPGRDHRDRLRPEARRSSSPTTRPGRSSRRRRTVNPANDIVVKLFAPTASCSPAATSAPAPRRVTYAPADSIPQGIYHAAGLPVRRPDRAVHCRRATTPAAVTSSDSGTAPPADAVPAEVALLHRQPDAGLSADRHARRTPWSAAGSPAPGCTVADRARSRNLAAPARGTTTSHDRRADFTTVGNNANTTRRGSAR